MKELAINVDGRRVSLSYDPSHHSDPELLDSVAQRMLDYMATCANRPPGLRDGTSILWGWSLLRARAAGGGLRICEADYASDPSRDLVDHVTFALQLTVLQTLFHQVIGVEPAGCAFHEGVVAVPGVLASRRLVMRRFEGLAEGMSGWVIGPEDADAFERALDGDALETFESWELVPRGRHHLLKAMSAPPGYVVGFEDHETTFVLDPAGTNRWPSR